MTAVHATGPVSQASSEIDGRVVVRSHLRLTARGRAVVTTLAALPLIVGALVLAVNGGGALAGDSMQSGASFDYITVPAGESLWSIAEVVAPEVDPRDVIDAIINLNQLSSADVQAGQRLALPNNY